MIKIKKSEFNAAYQVACDGWKKKFRDKFQDFIFSDDLEFEESFLEEMEKACDPNKPIQLETFKKIFKSYIKEDLFSQIKNYSDVCKKLGVKELKLTDFKQFGEDASKMLAFHQIKNIEKLFNQGWIKDWKNQNQYKYYPYFTVNSSGRLVFFDVYCYYSYFYSFVGLYKDSKTAQFVGKTFIDIYQELI